MVIEGLHSRYFQGPWNYLRYTQAGPDTHIKLKKKIVLFLSHEKGFSTLPFSLTYAPTTIASLSGTVYNYFDVFLEKNILKNNVVIFSNAILVFILKYYWISIF